jgi:hypothetical protein
VWARLFLPDQHALIFSGAYNLGVKAADLKVDGELKEWVETGMSGGKVSRWFCPTCSSCVVVACLPLPAFSTHSTV